jgi:hypothetical protein
MKKNKKFVVTAENACRVAGVTRRKLQVRFPNAPKIIGRTFYKTAELKAAFPYTYTNAHHEVTYSRLSEFIRDHLLAMFEQNPDAKVRGFGRTRLKSKTRYTERQINMAIWLYPSYFYATQARIFLHKNAPAPGQRITTCGVRPKNLARPKQPALPVQAAKTVPLKEAPKPRDPWAEFIACVRSKKPLISMWFDLIQFNQLSPTAAQLIVDERDSIAVQFIQQKDLLPWIEARFMELGFPFGLEVVVKRVRPEPQLQPAITVPALPPPIKQKPPKKGRIASALAAVRKFIERIIFL